MVFLYRCKRLDTTDGQSYKPSGYVMAAGSQRCYRQVKELILFFTKQHNVRLIQTESIDFADNKIKVTEKIEICFGNGRKHCWKRRKR